MHNYLHRFVIFPCLCLTWLFTYFYVCPRVVIYSRLGVSYGRSVLANILNTFPFQLKCSEFFILVYSLVQVIPCSISPWISACNGVLVGISSFWVNVGFEAKWRVGFLGSDGGGIFKKERDYVSKGRLRTKKSKTKRRIWTEKVEGMVKN